MPVWNAIALARACRAGLAGLALVALSASLAKAVFGPRTTIGKNYQQWSSTRSGNEIDRSSCLGLPFCFVLFQPIPNQRPLIIRHVACRAHIVTGLGFPEQYSLQDVFLGTHDGQDLQLRKSALVPVRTTGFYWAVNSPVMHLIKSGERPYVGFFFTDPANWNVECSISGKLK